METFLTDKEKLRLSKEELEYLERRPLKRLTHFDIRIDSFVDVVRGAYPLSQLVEFQRLAMERADKEPKRNLERCDPIDKVSPEMYQRHERCIDEFGCGMFGG